MSSKSDDIKNLFEKVLEIVDNGSHMPFSSKVSVPEAELIDIIDQLRESIPEEVERANRILLESENTIAKAKSEAASIIEDANEQAAKIVEGAQAEREARLQQSEIIKEAEEIANELKENVEVEVVQKRAEVDAYCAQTRTDVLKYADEVMGFLEDTLRNALDGIAQNRAHILEEIEKQKQSQGSDQNMQ